MQRFRQLSTRKFTYGCGLFRRSREERELSGVGSAIGLVVVEVNTQISGGGGETGVSCKQANWAIGVW